MLAKKEHDLVAAIRRSAHPLTGEPADFDPLLSAIGDSRLVLIGEAIAWDSRVLSCARADYEAVDC